VAGSAGSYRDFIARSRAELGVAKAGYVTARCGWFSDRSACYLASGKPVVAQDTGFGVALPTGEGLLAFASPEQAADGLRAVLHDRPLHARAARRLAEEHLAADRVVSRLLERIGAA
jgi:glycosyltransferase involved in cell wall biosynthesis